MAGWQLTRGLAMRSRWAVLLYGLVAYLLGIRALVYFVLFASNVAVVKTVDSGPNVAWPEALTVDVLLLLIFALPHSVLAREPAKRALARYLPETAIRSTYTLVAALSLSLLMWQWRPLDAVVWQVDALLGSYLLVGLAIAGWLLAAIAYYSIGHLELFGLRQAYNAFQGVPHPPGDLVTSGIYRYLRDPMYLGFAIGLWSTPRMTAGRLLLATGMSLYVLIGMRYEKRDLLTRFGDRYLDYLHRP